ncbi:MAG: hypothetical protein K2L04_08085 [Alistipes sp.]|nr:hypothetical protein [Alistipes sp.]
MNLKEIRNELRKLSALAEEWTSLQEIAPVERDMALEKLRDLYEALRFSLVPRHVVGRVLPQRTASEAPRGGARMRAGAYDEEESEFEMVDLNEVLSLGEDEEPAAAEQPEQPERAGAASAAQHTAFAADDAYDEEGPEIIEFEPEPEHVRPLHRPVHRPEPEELSEEAAEEHPAAQPARKPAAAQTAEPEPVQPAQPGPVAAHPAHPAQPARPVPPAEPVQEPAPTLFGDDEDEETLSHRRKQRVIRALYEPEAESAAAPKTTAAADGPFVEIEEPALPRQETDRVEQPQPAVSEQQSVVLERPQAAAEPETEIVLLDAMTEEPVGELRKESRPAATDTPDDHAPQVLGEVMNHDVRTLADTIARPRGNGSGRYAAPISDLRQAIGINDKFLMIRDLFGGDGALFDSTVEALNAQESLDDCMIYIAEHFAWNPESESAALIMELLERKFA